jgi:large subunit ribosomal protein L31
MKEKIHPEFFGEAQVSCACGNTFTVGSTRKVIKVDSCSRCNPFFTGERRIIDTAGQVEKFQKRYAKATVKAPEAKRKAAPPPAPVKAPKAPKAPKAARPAPAPEAAPAEETTQAG